MPRVLLTAFKPYDRYDANASWLAMQELTKQLPSEVELVTRLYPVDFTAVRQQLEKDLTDGYDFALHTGQAHGSGAICLEAIGLNLRCVSSSKPTMLPPLVSDGPLAVQSDLPLAAWVHSLREQQIPAEVSYHAGTYLCNAALYLSLYLAKQKKLPTRATFVHLPLAPSQVAGSGSNSASLPSSMSAEAIRIILKQLLMV